MSRIGLTQGYFAEVDEEDYERVSRFKWTAQIRRRRDGSIRAIYAVRMDCSIKPKPATVRLHRFILGVSDPKVEVDHQDHDGLNCHKSNLRVATKNQNQHNCRIRVDNTTGFKGVSMDRESGGYKVSIRVDGKSKSLGRTRNAEEGARRYNEAAILLHGEFANLNKFESPAFRQEGT